MRLRVMTYNIHAAKGVDAKVDLARIADVIRSYGPDLVALQEVDVHRARTGAIDQARELGDALGMTAVFAPTLERDGGHYGIATLSKLPVLEQR